MKPILLFGYGEMGPYALEGLSQRFNLKGVITPPENSRFRTQAVLTTEKIAAEKKIKVYRDEGLNWAYDIVNSISPEAIVIASYDKIIPKKIIESSKCINVHHGDLPRYRGRANINWAIINGRQSIGISVHEVVPELDAGGIYKMWNISIEKEDYISDIYRKVNNNVLNELPKLVEGILEGIIQPTQQVGKPTYCCTRLPEDGRINWDDSAENIRNLIRGISKPFPGAFSELDYNAHKEKLTIWRADFSDRAYEGNIPGRVGRIIKGKGVEILTKTNPLIITDVNYHGQDCRADGLIHSLEATLK